MVKGRSAGPRPYDAASRVPVTISRFAWQRLLERMADLEERVAELEGEPDDAA